MTIQKIKLCLFITVFAGLFSCTSVSTKTQEATAEVLQDQTEASTTTVENAVETTTEQVKQNELIIYQKSFLGLSPDAKITDYKGTLEKGLLQTGDGDFDILNVKDEKGNTVAYFVPFGEKEDKVGSITITTELAKTEDGIKIGDTFSTLLEKYPTLKVHGSEIEGYTQAIVGNLGYRLDEQHYNYELKISEIKKETKIIEIIVK